MAASGRFDSIEHIGRRAIATLARFPFTMASASIGTITAVYLVELNRNARYHAGAPEKLLMTCALGLPLFTALAVLAERRPWSAAMRRLFPAIGIVFLAAYYFSLPPDVSSPVENIVRFLLLALAAHFLVAFLPFLGREDRVGYWQYNKTLFLRLLLANIYFGVLFAGLSLALLAADHLFGLDVRDTTYPQLGLVLVGIVQTWIFLGGIPDRLQELNQRTDYPPGLKVFTQFILLPLVILYFVILVTYEAKILVTGNWPEGWVAHLVLWYSVASILSLLLLHPLQTQAGHRWITTFGTWFFRGLIPLLVMLYFAIYQRIAEYGVTVNRFLVVNMAVGLTVVVLYFVLGKSRDIRIIPIVLCLLCVVSAYGPFSAFAVSERSQRNRLELYLTTHGLLADGTIQAATKPIPDDDRREMSSIVDYLLEWHGKSPLADWVDTVVVDTSDEYHGDYQTQREVLSQRLGFTYAQWRGGEGRTYLYYSAESERSTALPLSGWSHLIEYHYKGVTDSVVTFELSGDSCHVLFDTATQVLTLTRGADPSPASAISHLDLGARIRELRDSSLEGTVDPARLVFAADSGSVRCEWHVEHIGGSLTDGQARVDQITARLLLDLKP